MFFSACHNLLNFFGYHKNNTQETQETQALVNNYIQNTEKTPHKKNIQDYTISIKEEDAITNIDSESEKNINESAVEDAYNKMFNSGFFDKIKQIQNKSMTAIEKRDFLSKLFINDIETELGKLNKEELQIIETMKALPNFKFQHQSNHQLVNNNILKICSRDTIQIMDTERKIFLHGFGKDYEIKNTDFVYFSVDFSGSSIKTPPTIVTHGHIFYGENSYVIPENIIGKNGYFTLVDQSTSFTYLYSKTNLILYKNGLENLPNLFNTVSNTIESSKYKLTPMFSLEDIRLGMALYIIKSIRQVDKAIASRAYKEKRNTLLNERAKFMEYLLEGKEMQNQLLNAILHLEYHAPATVELNPEEYAQHKVSELCYDA
jgi:hypothetical protein